MSKQNRISRRNKFRKQLEVRGLSPNVYQNAGNYVSNESIFQARLAPDHVPSIDNTKENNILALGTLLKSSPKDAFNFNWLEKECDRLTFQSDRHSDDEIISIHPLIGPEIRIEAV